MRNHALLLAICLLGAIFAFGQASSQPQAPAQQSSPSASQPANSQPSQSASPGQTTPQQPANAGPGSESDRTASGNTGESNPAATNGQPVQRQSRGTIGWGWLIVAVIVGVIIISLLSRGRDRVTHIDHTTERDRRPDDIRRVG